jgi:hypothetical protein
MRRRRRQGRGADNYAPSDHPTTRLFSLLHTMEAFLSLQRGANSCKGKRDESTTAQAASVLRSTEGLQHLHCHSL